MTILVRVQDHQDVHVIADPRDSMVAISRAIRATLAELGLPRSFEVRWCELAEQHPEKVLE